MECSLPCGYLDSLEGKECSCFEGVKKSCEFLCERVKLYVASWVSINSKFQDLAVDQIIFKWKEAVGLSMEL